MLIVSILQFVDDTFYGFQEMKKISKSCKTVKNIPFELWFKN